MSILQKPLKSVRSWLASLKAMTWIILSVSAIELSAQCPETFAYTGNLSTGNQAYTERLGLVFTASTAFTVTSLGAFDDGQNGFSLPVTVGILNSAGTTVVAPYTFNGTADPLSGFYRRKTITPVTLPAGQYVVVAVGYGNGELNGNSNLGVYPTVNTNSGGVLTFDNSSYGGVGFGLPTTNFVTPGAFHAGTFSFVTDTQVPEITCPAAVTMSADQDRCSAVVCFPITADDNCNVVLPISIAGHTYIGTFNGHTYFRSNSLAGLSWEQANAAAVALGGHLISINDQTEQSFINANIPNNVLNQFWIGLRYSPSLGQFKWTSGEPVNFFNWGIGQPVNFPVVGGDYVYHLEVGNPGAEGWYNIIPQVPRRYIVEFEGYPVNLISGIPSGSNFPVGLTTVSYRVTDIAGNTDQCTFDVVVTDDQAPEILCDDDVVVQLDPLECEGIAVFNDPDVTDNCPGVTYNLISGIASDELFPVGVNVVTFEATDAAGNTAQCSLNVTVLDYQAPPLGCKPVQISLDEDCEGELTPTMVLTGWEGPMGEILLGCESLYEIHVTGSNGEDLGNSVGNNELGKTLTYTITNVNGYVCWGDVKIEDKIAPTIVCRDITVNCLTDLSKVPGPIVDDNCSGVKAVLVNELHQSLECNNTLIGRVIRTWKAVDGAGNESAPCTQTINLVRSDVTGITPPALNVVLSCSAPYDRDDKGFGYPSPEETGVPYLGLTPLYPLSQLNMVYCNSTIDYTDVLIISTKCKTRILRTWTITEWWCSTAVSKFISMQVIDIVDDIAPVIPQQANATLTTQSRSCSATVQLPKLNITDNCNLVYRVYVNAYQNGQPTGYINSNGGIMDLAAGTHTITYTAIDECGNQSQMSYRITVQDNTDPVAICDQFATVSIKTNGYTEVTASAIDDGSFDECGPVTLQVRRMEDPCNFGSDTAWYDRVGFCCLDANTSRMVQLLVTDAGGNTNICMVTVNVQEKVNPGISCPGDITISDCLFTFDPSLAGANAAFGSAVINDNCPANNTLNHRLVDNRNQCGIGTVVRTFSVSQGGTTYGECVQTITFENNDRFYINRNNSLDPNDDIVWPKDYIALGQCQFAGLLPETLPDSSSVPVFTEDACDLVGMRYEDLVFPFTTNGACYKIIRTWTVIDWCQKDDGGNPVTWSYEQEIKVIDNTKPVITSPTTSKLVLTYDGQCEDGQIALTASATDCTPANELRWYWEVTEDGNVFRTGSGNNASGTYPIGKYAIRFTVEDKCGNVSETGYLFEIRNAKAPTAICKQGLSAALVLMDTNGDGTGDTPMTMLQPEFFDNKSSHVCGYDLQLSFSSNVNDTLKVFGCGQVGPQAIQMWVTDENGNTSYCETFVEIQATPGLCPVPPGLVGQISGRTITESNEEIEEVTVEMKGSEQLPVNTDENGEYRFNPMPYGGEYEVKPGKDGDDINGVSTLDIVMIQRHILGVEKLNSPYKLIAADANNSGTISASDLTELRKLVLGVTTALPNNTSWRFVESDFQFADKQDPWLTPFAEKYQIGGLNGNMDIDFIGIKVGDVNGNAKVKNARTEHVSTRTKTNVAMEDRWVQQGEVMEIAVMADQSQTVYGMQTQWQASGLIIRGIREGKLSIRPEDYAIRTVSEAKLSVVSHNGTEVSKNEVLYILEVEALKSGKLSQMLTIGSGMAAEVYVRDMETRNLGINWRQKTDEQFRLEGIAPNPWNTNTSVSFTMPKDGMVSFKVKDYTGRNVLSAIEQYAAGKNVIHLNKTEIGQAGVYVYELRFEDKVLTGKMILLE